MFYRFSAILAVFYTILSVSQVFAMQSQALVAPQSETTVIGQWATQRRIFNISFMNNHTLHVHAHNAHYHIDIRSSPVEQALQEQPQPEKITEQEQPQPEKITETTTHMLKIGTNCLFITDKRNNESAIITHYDRFTDAFFTPDLQNVVAISKQKITLFGLNGETSFARTPSEGEHIPDEWFKSAAVSFDGSKLAIVTTKNNIMCLDISNFSKPPQTTPSRSSHAISYTPINERASSSSISAITPYEAPQLTDEIPEIDSREVRKTQISPRRRITITDNTTRNTTHITSW